MKKHPTRKEIIGASLDAGHLPGPLRDHLASCPACGAIFAEATRLQAPSGPELLAPERVLERILAAQRPQRTGVETPGRSWKETFLRPVPVSALAAVFAAAIIIPLIFLLRAKPGDDMVPAYDMTCASVEGNSVRTITLAPADTVMTPSNGTARLRLGDRLDILLNGDSHLVLDSALRDRRGHRRRLTFTLAHGSLRARLSPKTGIEAVFITPHGRITALGTEFSLSVSGGTTSVLLREGALSVENASGGKGVITGGVKCVIDGGITKAPMNDADFKVFEQAPGTLKTAGTPESKKAHRVPPALSSEDAAERGPDDSAHTKSGVNDTTSRPAVREDMKNEVRGIKEMRRSLQRGRK